MRYQQRAKLALDTFQSYTSKIITPKAPIQEPTSRISQTGSSIFWVFFIFLYFSKLSRFNQIHSNPFLGGAKRYYYVDQYQVQHFRPRGPQWWFQNLRIVLVMVLVSSGVFITVYFGNLETVPYKKRTHFVLLSKSMERRLGEAQFEQMKAAFKGKILLAIQIESLRLNF